MLSIYFVSPKVIKPKSIHFTLIVLIAMINRITNNKTENSVLSLFRCLENHYKANYINQL